LHMGGRILRQALAAIGIAFSLVVFAWWLSAPSESDRRWAGVAPGMSQTEVKRILGEPAWTGDGEAIGSGDGPVVRWIYKRGRRNYHVDFDYVGPDRSPAVYRMARIHLRWAPAWWPPWRARAKA
jgi:hypothetical protein